MEFSCTCEIKGISNCASCPVTLNKKSVFDYINSRKEKQDEKTVIQRILEDTNLNAPTNGMKRLNDSLNALGEMISFMNAGVKPPFPISPDEYIGGIIHTGKLNNDNTDLDKPTMAGYNVYYNGHKVGSVNCYQHVKGPKDHWFLDPDGTINTKMSSECDIIKQ